MITLSLLHPIKQVPVQVWTFQNETTIRIGRSTDNQVILYSAVVSRHHVELRKLGNGWEIVNLGTNGTYLDGKRITQVIATDGAVIRLARSGPNIQIRFGEAVLNSVSRVLDTEKTASQGGELTNTPTEVTDYGVSESAGSEVTPITPEPRSTRTLGTIPVPDHLNLSLIEPAETIADISISVAAGCTHSRARSLFCPDCGVPTQIIQTIGEYELLEILGQGVIGITYLGWHHGHTVAIKTLNSQWVNQPKAHAALEYEADLLRALDHPRIPHVLDFFSVAGQPYLVMERMHGASLHQIISTRGAMPLAQAIAWLVDLCHTLEYLHSQTPPVVHRGICPANLLCLPMDNQAMLPGRGGAIALVGFGQVKASILGEERALNDGYSAPESLDVGAPPAVDLFSLAPVLVYLVTGRSPSSDYRLDTNAPFTADTIQGLSPDTMALLRHLTHPNIEHRYQRAADVTTALRSSLVSS